MNEDEFKAVYKTKFKKDGFFYDEVYDIEIMPEGSKKKYGFLKYIDDYNNDDKVSAEFVEYVDIEDNGVKYRVFPARQIASQKTDALFDENSVDFIKIPPMPIEYESEFALYKEIRAFIRKYVEVKTEDEILLSLWIMKASLFDNLKVSSFPMLHIRAPYGKGKTRLLKVLTSITPYGLYLINIGSASLKRISEVYSPVLYIDEMADMDSDLIALLNARYNKDTPFTNADNNIQRGVNSIITYRLFGPTCIVSRTPFKDDALESKSYQIDLNHELTDKNIPRNLKGNILDEFENEARILRGKLMRFRMKHIDAINNIQASEFLKQYEDFVEPRLYELLSFFEDLIEIMPEIKDEIANMLEYQIKKNVEISRETPNGIVAITFLSLMERDENLITYTTGAKQYMGVYLASIYEALGENYANQTGKILSALGLKTDRVKISFTNEAGKQKQKLVRVVRVPDEEKLRELRLRYDSEFVENVLDELKAGNFNFGIQDIQDIRDMANAPPIGIQDNQNDISLYKYAPASNNTYNNSKVSNNNNIPNILNSDNENNNSNGNNIRASKLLDISDTLDTKNETDEEKTNKTFSEARLTKWYNQYKRKLENADTVVRERRNIERLIASDFNIPIDTAIKIVDEWMMKGWISQSGNVVEFRGGK